MSTDNFNIQIRKGLLEFCVMQIISRGEIYTSDILEELKKSKIIVVDGFVLILNRSGHQYQQTGQKHQQYHGDKDLGAERYAF